MKNILARATIYKVLLLLLILLGGCSGDDGRDGETTVVGILPASSADSVQIKIEEIIVNESTTVRFTATDANQVPVAGLQGGRGGNLRFTIAKLMPGEMGDPSYWINYISNESGQATYERDGALEDLGNGKYSYTFEKDITNHQEYNAAHTHRLAMQIDGFPASNPYFDFRPDGEDILTRRDIVNTKACNSCHNKLALHGGRRIDVKYCTNCHTQDTSDPDSGNTLDFPVLIHKIHRGENLPSVAFGPNLIEGDGDDGQGVYQIVGFGNRVHDYSTVSYPQDIRNCQKCHDGSDPETPQGDNWKVRPSIKACGSCHDNIDFSRDGSPAGGNDPRGHSGGIVNDNTECLTCHAVGRIAGSIEKSHEIAGRSEAKNYAFNINQITGGATPVIDLSVINPQTGIPYDFAMGDEQTNPVFKASNARLVAQVAWSTLASGENVDYNNGSTAPTVGVGYTPSAAPTPAQPIGISFVQDCAHHLYGTPAVDPVPDWVCTDPDNNKIFTLTKQTPLPSGAAGTGRVAIEGHPALSDNSGRMVVKSVVADFAISDAAPVSRRLVVDINKCNQCHDQLSLHGSNRTDEIGLCVMCHNPSLTDISYQSNFNSGEFSGSPARPKALNSDGNVLYAQSSPLDKKTEASADFKAMIHGIHAGDKDNHGFRENGIQLRRDDFSHVRFPGILQDCQTCHLPGTYLLTSRWETPTINGLQSTSVKTTPAADENNMDPIVYGNALNDSSDDLRMSPTAAACSGCHDSQVAKSHMVLLGGAVFDQTQAYITDMTNGNFETCAICHGPGHIADVEKVHQDE